MSLSADVFAQRETRNVKEIGFFPMVRPLLLAATAMISLCVSAGAQEQAQVFASADPDMMLGLARAIGPAELRQDDNGNPLIRGQTHEMDYAIRFYGCRKGKACRSIQFAAGSADAFTADQANDWNTRYRWIRAYARNGSNFRMDIDFKGGITRDNVEAQFRTWDSFAADIRKSTE